MAARNATPADTTVRSPAPVVSGVFENTIDTALNGSIRFVLNARVYPVDLVYHAAFVYIDKYYVYIDRDPEGRLWVTLTGKEKLEEPELTAAMGDFANELLAQAVRKLVNKQNNKVREMIVAKALWGTGAVDIDKGLAYAERQEDQALRARLDDEARREQEELDRLLAEIEQDFAADPAGIGVPWDEKHGKQPKAQPAP